MADVVGKCIKGIEEIAKKQIEAGDEEGAIRSIDALMSIIGIKEESKK